MENSVRAIIIAAAIVITIALATIGFMVLSSGQDTARTALSKMGEMNTQLYESDYLMYDDKEVSGSEVVNALYKFREHRLSIKVTTNRGATEYTYKIDADGDITTTGDDIANVTNEVSIKYINPNGRFKGNIIRDKNAVITCITFTQK